MKRRTGRSACATGEQETERRLAEARRGKRRTGKSARATGEVAERSFAALRMTGVWKGMAALTGGADDRREKAKGFGSTLLGRRVPRKPPETKG